MLGEERAKAILDKISLQRKLTMSAFTSESRKGKCKDVCASSRHVDHNLCDFDYFVQMAWNGHVMNVCYFLSKASSVSRARLRIDVLHCMWSQGLGLLYICNGICKVIALHQTYFRDFQFTG